jgi:hypothetical protein
MKTFENKQLNKTFTWKRGEITGRRREFYNKEVHNFFACQNHYDATIKANEVGWACSRYEREALQSFCRKT